MLGGGRFLSSRSNGFTLADGTTCVATLADNRFSAFTLAEVLITLGIIGVVSAMTVPSLMQNYQRQSYVTQLHKVYNELNQALIRYQTDSNAVSLREAGLTSISDYGSFFKKYFNVVQDCGTTQTPCFSASYKKLSGVSSKFSCKNNCMVLASGASIGVAMGQNEILQFVVDINGSKGPNIYGRDAFSLYLYTNGVIDDLALEDIEDANNLNWANAAAPLTKEQREQNYTRACIGNNSSEWHGCFGKILNDNWQMTY